MDRIGGGFLRRAARSSRRWALGGAAAMALALGVAHHASAQSIEPSDLVPAPAGTNVVLGYYLFNHYNGDNVASGPAGHTTTVSASFNDNLFIERYVHFFALGDTPAGFQLVSVNGFQNGTIDGANVNTSGQVNSVFAVFAWPGANTANKIYPFAGLYIYPPINNFGSNGAGPWSGAVQLGINKGFGDNFSFDFDEYTTFFGETTGGGARTSTNPNFTLQIWANWNWTPQIETSIGWQSHFGGDGTTVNTTTGTGSVFSGSQQEEIRGWVSYFFLPQAQVGIEVNHDFVDVNGAKNQIGILLRALYIF